MIYLDYNASTPIDEQVQGEMIVAMKEAYGNPSSPHAAGRASAGVVRRARARVAKCLNAERASEIIFTSGATEANNLALVGAIRQRLKARMKQFQLAGQSPVDATVHVISSCTEHVAVRAPLEHLERVSGLSIRVTYLPCDALGRVTVESVLAALQPDTVLVSLMLANNETGAINPIAEMVGRVRERLSLESNGGESPPYADKCRVAFHTDASQAVGKLQVDVQRLGVDLLTVAGHKMYAAKGVGALFVRYGFQLAPLLHGAPKHEFGVRPGTESTVLVAGLGLAAQLVHQQLDRDRQHMLRLRSLLLNRLGQELIDLLDATGETERRPEGSASPPPPSVRRQSLVVHNSLNPDESLCNTLSVAFPGTSASAVVRALSNEVCLSAGAACHSSSEEGPGQPSAVLLALGLSPEMAQATLRISVGRDTREPDIIGAAKLIARAVINSDSPVTAGSTGSHQSQAPPDSTTTCVLM